MAEGFGRSQEKPRETIPQPEQDNLQENKTVSIEIVADAVLPVGIEQVIQIGEAENFPEVESSEAVTGGNVPTGIDITYWTADRIQSNRINLLAKLLGLTPEQRAIDAAIDRAVKEHVERAKQQQIEAKMKDAEQRAIEFAEKHNLSEDAKQRLGWIAKFGVAVMELESARGEILHAANLAPVPIVQDDDTQGDDQVIQDDDESARRRQ